MNQSQITIHQPPRKALFYDPYIDTVGGGERYVFTLVEHLLNNGWQVDVLWKSPEVIEKLESRFGLVLKGLNFINFPTDLIGKYNLMKKYDLSFWLSDGSIPLMFSANNILHIQVPFHDISGGSLPNKLKLRKINLIICNSNFTKNIIDKEFGIKSQVVYPPVEIERYKPGNKENIILYVGRFSKLLQAKRQDVLITVFKRMVNEGFSGWKLVLAGGADVGAEEYLTDLRKLAKNYPIEILTNLSFEEMQHLYGKAKIFWSAAGYDVDERKNPERVEHFGMTVVEAMSSGCVPIVIEKGGVKEMIQDSVNGFFWQEENDLISSTLKITKDEEALNKISTEVIKLSKKYSKERFCREFDEYI